MPQSVITLLFVAAIGGTAAAGNAAQEKHDWWLVDRLPESDTVFFVDRASIGAVDRYRRAVTAKVGTGVDGRIRGARSTVKVDCARHRLLVVVIEGYGEDDMTPERVERAGDWQPVAAGGPAARVAGFVCTDGADATGLKRLGDGDPVFRFRGFMSGLIAADPTNP